MKRGGPLHIHKLIGEEVFVFLFEFDDGVFCLQIYFAGLSISLGGDLKSKVVKLKCGEIFILYHKVKRGFFFKCRVVMIESLSTLGDDPRSCDDDKEKQEQRRQHILDIAAVLAQVYGICKCDGL